MESKHPQELSYSVQAVERLAHPCFGNAALGILFSHFGLTPDMDPAQKLAALNLARKTISDPLDVDAYCTVRSALVADIRRKYWPRP